MTVTEVPTDKLIEEVAKRLEKMPEFKPPLWSVYVKTGMSRERPPLQTNWWWIRAASIMRKSYLDKGIGVSRLRKLYGGRKNRGHKPEHKFRSSGSIIRKIMQQMEAAGYLQKQTGKTKKGTTRVMKRVLTTKGAQFLNEAAKAVAS